MDRASWADQLDQLAASFEERIEGEVADLLEAERKSILAAMRKVSVKVNSGSPSEHHQDPRLIVETVGELEEALITAINQALDERHEVSVSRLEPLFAELLDAAVGRAGDVFGVGLDPINPILRRWLRQHVTRLAARLSLTSKALAADIVHQALLEGKSVTVIRRMVSAKWKAEQAKRARVVARTESIRAANRGIIEAMRVAGIVEMEWVAENDERTCDWCAGMDGQTFGVGEVILEQGSQLVLDDGRSMTIGFDDVDSPPLHPDCRCVVAPVSR